MSWLGKSILALVLVTPVFMSSPILKERGLRPESWCLVYYLGCAIGIALYVWKFRFADDLVAHPWMSLGMLLVGVTAGAAVQILLFGAMSEAPNQGVPPLIVNLAGIIICLITPLLYKLAPQVFVNSELNWQKVLGIALTIIGSVLVVLKK